MRRQSNVYGLLAAAAALGLWGCTDFPGPDTGGCTSDTSCATTEMCHPVLKQCVTSCTAGADCPQEAKTCELLASSTKKFCQCATDALCANATANNVCMEATKQCAPKCTASSGCPSGYDCATSTGQCVKGTTDAGTADAGTPDAGAACTYRSCTGTKESCNLTAGRCETVACSSANAQPDTCGNARYCAGDNGCYDLPADSCGNFALGGAYGGPKYNPPSSTGPIIYYIEETTDDAAFCHTTDRAFSFLVYAYRTDANWPAQASAITSSFSYVNSAGSSVSAIPSMRPSGYTPSGREATFKVTLCAPLATNTLTAGFVFSSGNEYCTDPASGTPGTVP